METPTERVSKVCVCEGVTGSDGEGEKMYCLMFSHIVPSKGSGKERISVNIFFFFLMLALHFALKL